MKGREGGGGDGRERLTAKMRESEDVSPHLPLDLDRPRFFQHAGSPALTQSLHRRTAPSPPRTRGPLTDGRKAEGKRGRLTVRGQRTDEETELISPGNVGTVF